MLILASESPIVITPLTLEKLSGNKVVTDMFERPDHYDVEHISLANKADLFLIVPATANIIGKVANGIADDMLSTTIMATDAPVIFAPAMNNKMYANPIVRDNIKKLESYGYRFIEPTIGHLACGYEGIGKLPNTEKIIEYIKTQIRFFSS